MRDERPSSTAAIVAAARALIHRRWTVEKFSDPYAEELIPEAYLRWVTTPGVRTMLTPAAQPFALRTVAIDEEIRRAADVEQLVILGAGLDARAWRLPELADIDVFEVDHPSTQRYKRERIESFESRPRHRFVAVDFERDSLRERLEAAGHDTDRTTVWIWEGVTMYLDDDAIDATLGTVSERSTPGSRLLVTYIRPTIARILIGVYTRVLGEPIRSSFQPDEMEATLRRHGFEVIRDESGADWHERWNRGFLYVPPFALGAEHLATGVRRSSAQFEGVRGSSGESARRE